jgi:general stress protein 26
MNQQTLADFQTLVREFDTVMMTTVGPDGHLHSRPMATQPPLNDSPLWFVTSLDSEKARDLEANPRINLGYYRGQDGAYVSVSGTARIERNPDRVRSLWKDSWSNWFPKGADDADLAILHVTPQQCTHWEPGGPSVGQKTWAILSGDTRVPNAPSTVNF